EAHLLECRQGARHVDSLCDEKPMPPAMLLENGGGVDGIFPGVAAPSFQDQSAARCADLNQEIGNTLRLGDIGPLPRQIPSRDDDKRRLTCTIDFKSPHNTRDG